MVRFDFEAVAEDYVERRFPGAGRSLRGLPGTRLDWDEEYCRAVAESFHRAPAAPAPPWLLRSYRSLQRESLMQFRALLDAGLRIEPWHGEGSPYADSGQLRRSVLSTGVLLVYLTRSGHGPRGTGGPHPMREPSPFRSGGVRFTHNDVFRAVHDVFGHVVHGNGFGPRGEFRATYCHMRMYPRDVHPVLFTEQVAQICWFYYGPHLADAEGRLPRRGEPGYVPPPERPYPEQKVVALSPELLRGFRALFTEPLAEAGPNTPGGTHRGGR
ncbi:MULTISPECIES: crotonobetainyl-CoA--carnitine CoA-transferase [unclassified Nocardiopsis]|uniref:crotonobetainyl-CoA--carnitine CoA-transferase n=1 Tax=unclassified Nocardiopsis TaxID=2649073 RepID=UPI0019150482|nr:MULTISPECIES: crotonobetainyl-CoA--carnitine CoA-transferase [unclassified Nocardiopsis]